MKPPMAIEYSQLRPSGAVRDSAFMPLLEDIYQLYNHDFRYYVAASLKRRLHWAMRKLHLDNLGDIREFIASRPHNFNELLHYMTVPVSSMFRDPAYFLALREHIIPVLKTYSSPKIWVAGCCTGEEAYSIAILLHEEGLLERTLIYATDINPKALQRARSGIFKLDDIRGYTENYQMSGGRNSFSDYYHAAYDNAVLDRALRTNIVFAEHSLATDSSFAEMHFISCRNVLIYFQRELQDRVLNLFRESLCRKGFLGLGARESLDFSSVSPHFDHYLKCVRLYRNSQDTASIGRPMSQIR